MTLYLFFWGGVGFRTHYFFFPYRKQKKIMATSSFSDISLLELKTRIQQKKENMDEILNWYSDIITQQLYQAFDYKPEMISRIKHPFLTKIGSHLDRIAPDRFAVSPRTIEAGARCLDIDTRWKHEFGSNIIKDASGAVDMMAKMFFGHIICLAEKDSCIPLVDDRRSGDRNTSVDCAILTNTVITVECKTIQRSLGRKNDSYLLHCSSPKTMGVCDSYFVILWKPDVNKTTVFRDATDFLSKIRRVVFITRAELARAKKLQQSACRLTLGQFQLDPLQGHANVKKTKEKLQVLIGTEDVDYVSIENRHRLSKVITQWAFSSII